MTRFKFSFCFIVALMLHVRADAALTDFNDAAEVPAWASTAFEALLENEIISGTANNQLNSNDTINRAELTKILLKASKQNLITPNQASFKDVNQAQWFFPYVETAASLNWLQGYPDGSFKPGNAINRAEIAKLINKATNTQTITVNSDNAWFEAEIRALATQNLLPYQVTENNFQASVNPTRAEVFEQIYRAFVQPPTIPNLPDNETSNTPKSVEAVFAAPTTFTPVEKVSNAGDLNVSGLKNQNSNPKAGQSNVTLGQYKLQASSGQVKLNGLQLRRIGNGSISNYQNLWLEISNQVVTEKQTPNNDLVTFNFKNDHSLSSGQMINISLKGNMSAAAKAGSSERFVLFLPTWINSSSERVIGLFPVAGSDIKVQP